MTALYPHIVYGPVRSRRLGLSLGVNLLPLEAKLCTFDCIYCECGWNGDNSGSHGGVGAIDCQLPPGLCDKIDFLQKPVSCLFCAAGEQVLGGYFGGSHTRQSTPGRHPGQQLDGGKV